MASDWETHEGERWAGQADRYDRLLAPFGEVLLAAAGLTSGERVVDIGCGNGAVSQDAARAVGAGGSVTGVDIAAPMLAVARARGAAAGLDQLTFELADATTWRPDAPADVVISRFGVMFFDDPVAAFANIRAGLRGGGRLVFAAWQAVLDNPWMVVPAAAVGSVLTLPAPTDPGAPGPFAFADADRVRSLLAEAGWTEVVIDAVRRPMWVGADPADAVGFFRSTRLGQEVFRSATPDQIAAAEAAAIDALGIHVTDDGVVLDGAAWVVTARA